MVDQEKILLVDDEPQILLLFSKFLADQGYSVRSLGDGLAAIEALQEERFHLALLDIGLPGLSGLELLSRIKAESPQTEVILFTGDAGLESAIQALRLGAYDYLLKSEIRLDKLKTVVALALERRRLAMGNQELLANLRLLNEELEQRVRERTAQLEDASNDLESLSYSVAQDLKTPVRTIEGFSRMLLGEHTDKLDAEALRLLQVINANTKLMQHLIDDLLALSRLGRLQIRKSSVNLASMAALVFEKLRAQQPERDLRLTVGDLPSGLGDQSWLYQVMENLLANAVKFTKSRETTVIEVGGRTEGEENIYYVEDNGIGFDDRYVDNLFRPFQHLHPRAEYEGTGIGLAIVQRIIQRQGGRVWAQGKVNEGATFYFSLPNNRA
jgi:signal transduction histidine kinase